jgi:hypothetical protein
MSTQSAAFGSRLDWKVVLPKSNFLKTPEIDSYHAQMFHGLVVRQESRRELIVNGTATGHLTCPGEEIVVTELLKRRLDDKTGVSFSPAAISRVAILSYMAGNFAHWDDPNYSDDGTGPERLLVEASRPYSGIGGDLPLPNLYFLEGPKFRNVCAGHRTDLKLNIAVQFAHSVMDLKLSVPESVLSSYELITLGNMLFFRAGLLEGIQDLIDWTYFERSEVLLDSSTTSNTAPTNRV